MWSVVPVPPGRAEVRADKAGEDGPNLLVRGVEGLVVLVLLGGIVAFVRRRRA